MNEKTVYVGIRNKSEIRRELLESSKDIVGVLKNYDKLNAVREEKIEKIMELKNILAELKQINGLLKDQFPSEKISEKKPVLKKSYARKAERLKPRPAAKKPSSEIKKLEEELGEIEERLSKMGS